MPGVDVEIENHVPPKNEFSVSRLIERASENLGGENPEAEPPKKRGRKPYVRPNQREDISSLVVSLVTLAIASLDVPEQIKPNEAEVTGFSQYATRIFLRHVDISGRMTADMLDAIGLIAVLSGWYARVSPELHAWRKMKRPSVNERSTEIPYRDNGNSEILDPIENLSPGTSAFLKRSQEAAGNGHAD